MRKQGIMSGNWIIMYNSYAQAFIKYGAKKEYIDALDQSSSRIISFGVSHEINQQWFSIPSILVSNCPISLLNQLVLTK
ncbi:MAG: hypothetical protein ACJAUR_001447 [Ulvibacter sp.]|jgi:hypothetical protein